MFPEERSTCPKNQHRNLTVRSILSYFRGTESKLHVPPLYIGWSRGHDKLPSTSWDKQNASYPPGNLTLRECSLLNNTTIDSLDMTLKRRRISPWPPLLCDSNTCHTKVRTAHCWRMNHGDLSALHIPHRSERT